MYKLTVLALPIVFVLGLLTGSYYPITHPKIPQEVLADETIISTPVPTSSPAPTIKPTPKATATPSAKVKAKIVTTPSPSPIELDSKSFIMKAINDYRTAKGLKPVQTSNAICSFAKTRAQEIAQGFNHDGFINRLNSKTIPFPFAEITENIAQTSNYKDVVNMWINSPTHAANMQKDTPFVCIESVGQNYAYEGMRP